MRIQPSLQPAYATEQSFNTLSEHRVKQIALIFFSALSIGLGTVALSVGTGAANFVALVSFSAAGVLIWAISKIKQYDNPIELSRYRKEAQSMSLDEIIKEHGWENCFRYEIPKQGLFQEKFLKAMKFRTINEVLSIYEKAEDLIKKTRSPFTLPSCSVFRDKFLEETKALTPCEIFKAYDVEKLHNLGIASQDLLESSKKFAMREENYMEDVKEAKETFAKTCREALSALSTTLKGTTAGTSSETLWIEKLKREAAHLATIEPSTWHHSSTDILKFADLPSGTTVENSMSSLHGAHTQFVTSYNSAKETLDKTIQELGKSRDEFHQQLNAEYD